MELREIFLWDVTVRDILAPSYVGESSKKTRSKHNRMENTMPGFRYALATDLMQQ